MAVTTEMRLLELVVLKQDIQNVNEYLGKSRMFQFESLKRENSNSEKTGKSVTSQIYNDLQKIRSFYEIPDISQGVIDSSKSTKKDEESAEAIISVAENLRTRVEEQQAQVSKVKDALKEAMAFSNLQVSYSELEKLTFLSLRIGRISLDNIPDLKDALGDSAVVIPLGSDSTRILAASSKKGRFALDTELNRFGFVNMEIPKDFKGIPEDVIQSLSAEVKSAENKFNELKLECEKFKESHAEEIQRLLKAFFISLKIENIQDGLESTSLVYHFSGWVPLSNCQEFMRNLDEITEGRIAMRQYAPDEVPAVINGTEQVPVKLKHGKFIASFERMIFSYGSPLYGNIDPTPFVAIFFTFLFGIMFGDCGQGLCFVLAGILMAKKVIKVGGWNKFAPIFIGIGISSSIMGLITGEFFSNESLLEPFALWVTGLFGTPHAPIVKMMPSSDPNSIKVIFGIFGLTIAVGFLINSIGLIINMMNRIRQKKWGSAFFGKTGLSGALFFWYTVIFALRLAFFKHSPAVYDWIVIGVTLFFSMFGEVFERLFDGERPVIENGVGAMLIGAMVELIEVVSTYLSSSISFMRVGAFALAHAVLGFIIHLMAVKSGVIGGVFVLIIGNAIVVVLEGMIVAIQVIRLQYYEFFSKFFNETGVEFKPFQFCYENKN